MIDWQGVYAELKGWQQSLAALLGFSALIAAALFNARLNRRRDERLRVDEARAVAAALYGEMIIVQQSLGKMAKAVARRYVDHGLGRRRGDAFDKHLLEEVGLPPITLYPALAAKVGLLPSDIAREVVRFYARRDQAQSWLQRLPSDAERPFDYAMSYVLDPCLDAIRQVQSALRAMEQLTGVAEAEPMPDIAYALDARETERTMFEG